METGQDRAERLNQRLRGAGRANVGSDDFNLDIEGIGEPFTQPSSSPASAARPNAQAAQHSPEIPSAPQEPNEPVTSPSIHQALIQSPPRPAPYDEEITESPAHAPGSGHRRRLPVQEVLAGAARMRSALEPDPIQPISLPPLRRPPRQSQAPSPTRNTPPTPAGPSGDDESDDPQLMPPPRVPQPAPRPPPAPSPVAESPSPEAEEAEEIGDDRAAATIGRKRPRVSFQPPPSPELGSEEDSDTEPAEERPAAKRPRPQPAARREPAAQRQPKRRNAAEGGAGKRRGRPPKESARQRSHGGIRAGSADDNVIEITVQRFVNGPDGAESDDEGGQTEAALANRNSETVVDVFAQVCDEVISTTLGKYEYLRQETQDEDKKKDCRIKMRAIEAFREEVSAQLLQHSIYLNHWYSLRKRIRHVQKEKLELRQEILRLKAEKEQVALRMDGVRARSEKDGSDSKHRLSASNLMHDIDLAVEQGRDAADLSSRARKEAELGNLELIISQVAQQASSNGPTGGLLHQIQDFNAFLERAATVLESR
ncbi:triadin, putative [Cordyceps militaris CM01]|uniref:Triadin, putative n=1 Tax=Cordyceps militaris (strain CM01) TaxID=983644 RepID=G3J361_CORMM|nr:triadin, putative [Cordyceps militaris CM01]EGX96442.1 triadin, putative [Cordyceps militaris CM01]